jgi:hypothetical protein
LAANFRKQADELQDTWPTVARILRSLADSYDSDARRNEADAERFRKGLEGSGGGPLQGNQATDVLYFAYGSNMKTSRIKERVGKVDVRGSAKLEDYRIAFNKTSTDRTGKTNIARRKGSEVWGVVFGLTQEQFDKLASFERGYKVESLSVRCGNETPEVKSFIAEETTSGLRPSREYLDYLIGGAREHGLPDDYVKLLEAVKVAKR